MKQKEIQIEKFLLQAFNQEKTINLVEKNLLINSSNAAIVCYCWINKIKYRVSSLLLNQML